MPWFSSSSSVVCVMCHRRVVFISCVSHGRSSRPLKESVPLGLRPPARTALLSAAVHHVGHTILLGRLFRLELDTVPPHAARVIVKGDPSLLLGDKAVRHHVPHHPALEPTAGCVNSGVLEPASLVARPVVCRLWRGLVHIRAGGTTIASIEAVLGGAVGQHNVVTNGLGVGWGEVEIGCWLRGPCAVWTAVVVVAVVI
jgi:hypothetical protein